MKTIAFFNNKGGVGKTTLAYHCAHMMAELGYRCLVADLDPQCNLTSMFLTEEEADTIYQQEHRNTIQGALTPLAKGTGDIAAIDPVMINDRLSLLCGDLELSMLEDHLNDQWSLCNDRHESALRFTTAIYRMLEREGQRSGAAYCIVDMGPNLGPLNRATLIGCDHVVVPMGSDLFSLLGLRNIGNRVKIWRDEWADRKSRFSSTDLDIPQRNMDIIGYVLMQQHMKTDRPIKTNLNWADKIPAAFRAHVTAKPEGSAPDIHSDPYCLAMIRHFHSLAPMAMEARKPIFQLKPADGAIGAHYQAVQAAYDAFKHLTLHIIKERN